MRDDQCGHGKTWAEECLECEAVSLRETIASFEPMVVKAKKRLKEVEHEIATQAKSKARLDMASRADRTNHGVSVGDGCSTRRDA